MYCVTFVEGSIDLIEGSIDLKNFFYHNIENAVKLQRDLLVTEVNKVLTNDECYINTFIKFDSCSNTELQRLLNSILLLKHGNGLEMYAITIEVTEIKFED